VVYLGTVTDSVQTKHRVVLFKAVTNHLDVFSLELVVTDVQVQQLKVLHECFPPLPSDISAFKYRHILSPIASLWAHVGHLERLLLCDQVWLDSKVQVLALHINLLLDACRKGVEGHVQNDQSHVVFQRFRDQDSPGRPDLVPMDEQSLQLP